jgi:uncharacterized protein (TIGR01244 family)
MGRLFFAALSGGLFGLGLVISGMTDTRRVQGFLDLFGGWDPTLIFVMGGAMVPMAIAWVYVRGRRLSFLGAPLPERPAAGITPALAIGSALFGIGWGLAGLCPGPAMASITFGGISGLIFLAAMIAGMVATPRLRALFVSFATRGHRMDIRRLTDTYAVSPQIMPEDVAAIAAAGFTAIVDNRPDGEIPPEVQSAAIRKAAEAAGLAFVANPVIGGAITMDNIRVQGAALSEATGPVFAYCASGNRSSVVWALSQAGARPTDELIAAAARFGYNLEPFRAQIDALSANRG